ncbi:hypothetical protein GOV09_06080 [Candidatus Woesearchaeota archaeon]|nr:hypothetical protein [Candidatus Woesearchaeota archaeon]
MSQEGASSVGFKRATAYKVPVKSILESEYIRTEGEFSPNYLNFGEMQVSRVNLIGVVVAKSDDSFMIDDGTGRISARVFEQRVEDIQIGDILMVIGKPREFNNERYIVPEIFRKSSEKWMRVRKLETKSIVLPEKIEVEDVVSDDKGLLSYIKSIDKGKGVAVEEIIKKFPDSEKEIETLLKEGDLFENMPGKVKVLE